MNKNIQAVIHGYVNSAGATIREALFGLMVMAGFLCATSCSEPEHQEKPAQELIIEETLEEFTCEELPAYYASYEEATKLVLTATFPLFESVNTTSSSWIRSASYYSCDGNTGYMIIDTDKQTYLHANIPLHVWESFMYTSSFGNFYNRNIKGRYPL